jgi:hypothetical protein
VQKIVNDLDAEYTGELSLKQQEIRETRQELRVMQAQLEEVQMALSTYKNQAMKLEDAEKRIKMLEAALNGRDGGLLQFESYDSNIVEDANSVLNVLDRGEHPMLLDTPETEKENLHDPPVIHRRPLLQSPRPSNQTLLSNTQEALQEAKIQQLQQRIHAYGKSELELKKEVEQLKSKSSDKELQCKRLIAVCCGIQLDRVDDLLQPLIQAVESEEIASLDIGKMVGFMATVQGDADDGIGIPLGESVGQ